jgi:predicted nucleic acid-binding protein
MALYMLATDIAVCLIRGTSQALDGRIESVLQQELCISAITRGELLWGLSSQTLQMASHGPAREDATPAPATVGRRRRRPYLRAPTERPGVASSLDRETLDSLRKTTHSVLASLTPPEAKALRRRFAMDSNADVTLEEVGRRFDATRERIRHMEQAQHLSRLVDEFFVRVSCLPWDADVATHFANVAIELHHVSTSIGTTDMMIAAHAIAVGAVLVTSNERDFARVRGLRLENWTR